MRIDPGTFVAWVLLLSGAAAGCRTMGESPPYLEGGVEIGLRRGAGWATLKVRPPYVVGASTSLKLERGLITGSINFHGVNIKVDRQGASGMGPEGPVALDLEEVPDALVFEGTWNGSRTNFRITADSLRGTIPLYSPGLNPGRGGMSLGTATCQYVLDKVEANGSRSGVSICSNLPEETLLEVPPTIHKWLTRSELMVVLLALLSAPPYSSMERR